MFQAKKKNKNHKLNKGLRMASAGGAKLIN